MFASVDAFALSVAAAHIEKLLLLESKPLSPSS
jgi:hypothetical protein